jgi:hypothetical protein
MNGRMDGWVGGWMDPYKEREILRVDFISFHLQLAECSSSFPLRAHPPNENWARQLEALKYVYCSCRDGVGWKQSADDGRMDGLLLLLATFSLENPCRREHTHTHPVIKKTSTRQQL